MPFASESQKRMMYANFPHLAEKFQKETPKGAKLPEHVGEPTDDPPTSDVDEKLEIMAKKLDDKLAPPMDAKEEARIMRLLDRFGAPEEWTESIKVTLGPDNMRAMTSAFKAMSEDEKAAFREKWEAREHGEEAKKMPMAAKAAEGEPPKEM